MEPALLTFKFLMVELASKETDLGRRAVERGGDGL